MAGHAEYNWFQYGTGRIKSLHLRKPLAYAGSPVAAVLSR
jgi:hypothetical protein